MGGGKLLFNWYRVLGGWWKILGTDSGDGSTTLKTYLMLPNHTLTNG